MQNKEKKVLHLTLNKKWFDMIASGEKKEEYRAIKTYWASRIASKSYNMVEFVNGYGKNCPRMLVECKGITKGLGILEWGAPPDEVVYIINLGEILAKSELLGDSEQFKNEQPENP